MITNYHFVQQEYFDSGPSEQEQRKTQAQVKQPEVEQAAPLLEIGFSFFLSCDFLRAHISDRLPPGRQVPSKNEHVPYDIP
jgi:hypothetical protein